MQEVKEWRYSRKVVCENTVLKGSVLKVMKKEKMKRGRNMGDGKFHRKNWNEEAIEKR